MNYVFEELVEFTNLLCESFNVNDLICELEYVDSDGDVFTRRKIIGNWYVDIMKGDTQTFDEYHYVHGDLVVSFSNKQDGDRIVSFGKWNPNGEITTDTSIPVGSSPLHTIRTVKKVLDKLPNSNYTFNAGDERLEKFYSALVKKGLLLIDKEWNLGNDYRYKK
jgi:hypothetical protein